MAIPNNLFSYGESGPFKPMEAIPCCDEFCGPTLKITFNPKLCGLREIKQELKP